MIFLAERRCVAVMGKKKPQSWGRWSFPAKGEAEEAVRAELKAHGFFEEFDSPMLVSLIAEKHYFCAPNRIRPGLFRKVPGQNEYVLESDFPDEKLGWHDVSWTKCLKERRDQWHEVIKRAMRDRTEPIKAAYKEQHPFCEVCGVAPTDDAHHKDPPFRDIVKAVREQVTDDEVEDCLGDWDWRKKGIFKLPEGHRITELFDELHAKAELQAVCKPHHDLTRKRTPK